VNPMKHTEHKLPPVVTQAEWQAARDQLLVKEKAATRVRDALAAERRRLPMVRIEKDYIFAGAGEGKARLVDLFEGRAQLILYHFMFGPDESQGCAGCSMTVDNLGHLAHLQARDTSLALVSRAPYPKLRAFQQRMGWRIPWYSSFGTDFNADFRATVDGKEQSLTSVFVRDREQVFRTYSTSGRGDEMLGSVWSLLDLTPYGRQETWEDSPPGWPQSPPYEWWRHHDRYDEAVGCC
jgi:predicted dithiol-disulfide oxidoreductase (DUF899 family)